MNSHLSCLVSIGAIVGCILVCAGCVKITQEAFNCCCLIEPIQQHEPIQHREPMQQHETNIPVAIAIQNYN